MTLSRRQEQILTYISNFIRDRGRSPSYAEIASAIGLQSLGTVSAHVRALATAGYLTIARGKRFGISLSDVLKVALFKPEKKWPPTPDADTNVEYLCHCVDGGLKFWQVLEWDGENFLLMEEPYSQCVQRWGQLPEGL